MVLYDEVQRELVIRLSRDLGPMTQDHWNHKSHESITVPRVILELFTNYLLTSHLKDPYRI